MNMLRALRNAFSKFHRPQTLVEALYMIFPSAEVDEAVRAVAGIEVLEYLAKAYGLKPIALLYEVAARLGLPLVEKLSLPSKALLARCGYGSDVLCSLSVMPQRSADRHYTYMMVVSDPASIAVEEYVAQGVQVAIALESSIAELWAEYALNPSKNIEATFESNNGRQRLATPVTLAQESEGLQEALPVLLQLARDAFSLGAQEVFLGHPNVGRYEFLSGTKKYQGVISARILSLLLDRLGSGATVVQEVSVEPFTSLSFSLTRNEYAPVVYCTWTLGTTHTVFEEVKEKAIEAPQPIAVSGCVDGEVCVDFEVIGELSSATSQDFSRATILLVEDDVRFALLLSEILSRHGYHVMHESSAEAALLRLSGDDAQFDLIISDIHMHGCGGAGLLAEVRRAGLPIPVIMLTSDNDTFLSAKLIEAGASAFVKKQEELQILLAWCANLLKSRSFQKAPSVTAAVLSSTRFGHTAAENNIGFSR